MSRLPRVTHQPRRAKHILLDLPRDYPKERVAYLAWVQGLAVKILNEIPEGQAADKELQQLVEMVNRLPTDWLIVHKVDHHTEEIHFDAVPRLGPKVPLIRPRGLQ